MVGAGIGLIFGYTRGSDPPCSGQEICTSLSAESKAVLWGAGLGLLGAVIGGLYGNTHPVPDWKPVGVEQIPESLSIDCDHRGISLSYGF